tara:strand:- start:40 stop:534 length:495 start_codon:yes stop_codon:yes gene_type:complete
VTNAGNGRIYVTDRWTGDSYYILGNKKIFVEEKLPQITNEKPLTIEQKAISRVKEFIKINLSKKIKLGSKIKDDGKPWEKDWGQELKEQYQARRLGQEFITVVRVYQKTENLIEKNKKYTWTNDVFEFRIADNYIRQITDSGTGNSPDHDENVRELLKSMNFEK